MVNILPIGTIVTLKEGNLKLMIVTRYPVYQKNNILGYFDYLAISYPLGISDEEIYYFNEEDIEMVLFTGYIDENELKAQKLFKDQVEKIEYPHFTIEQIMSIDEL